MNNVNKLKVAVLSVAMFGMLSGVANAAETTGKSSVELVRGLSIAPAEDTGNSHGSELYFGKVTVPTQGDATVTVSPRGETSATGTDIITEGHEAKFLITGTPGKEITIELNESSIMTNDDGTTLNVSAFRSNKDSVSIKTNGLANFKVGATVTIPQDASIGEYTGTFNVTVNY